MNDPVGHLQFVTNRTLGGYPVQLEWKGSTISTEWYRANQQSENAPNGFGQEEVIKQIWSDLE
jgi:hypothetical protein